MEEKKISSFLERLKEKAREQENYGGKSDMQEAKMEVTDCPNCGAGRAKQDGITNCAYCGFEFVSVRLTDGIHLKKTDNSI
jgi:uncharacterized Zn finger protein (UPF0148 family)